ncbi:MAG TPA: PAS domain S-box protein, partial [Bacteroidia bacterium]|nr:PAS domain S-box protein [Bacteroidia bacterium]
MVQSNSIYKQMLEEIEDYAILLLDLKGNVMTWNKRAEKIKGYKAEEIIGKNFRLFYTQEDQARSLPEKLIEKAALKGKATDEGWRMRKDGTRFWGSILITAIHDEENAVVGFSKVTRDLTGKKKAEELEKSLGQTKEGLLKMFNASPSGMIMIDLKSRMYIDVNKNFLETFGYRRDEVVGLTLADMSLVTVETREKLFTKLKQQGYFKNEEVFCHSKDGREITCIVSADSFEMDGEKYILYVIHDISAIKAMERKIAESEEKFQKAFQASGAGITITKLSNGIYSEVNDAFTKLTGYSKEELIGHSSAEIDLVVDTGQREEMLRQLREHGSLEQVELTIRTKSGKLIEIISTI